MLFSRPAFWSALCSCLAHSLAVGLAATLLISPPQSQSQSVKIILLQRAVLVPVEGKGDASAGAPAPMPEKTPAPAPHSQPRTKPRPLAKRPPQPAVIAAPAPVDTPPPLSPAMGSGTEGSESRPSGGMVAANGGVDAGGSGGKTGAGVGSGSGPNGGGGISAQPDYGVNPKPQYPLIARRLGAQGVVVLRVQVREDGSVAAVELARSSGFALLDDSASRTVRERWRFVPARLDGTPVESWVEVPIRFVLEDS